MARRASRHLTYGLTHLALRVPDPKRSLAFYNAVVGMVPVYEGSDFVQGQTPGARDVMVFERASRARGRSGDVAHFGFRLRSPGLIDEAARRVEAAGGEIVERGSFVPGEPYLFARDLDGYLFELWYERPTKVDP